MSGDWHLLKLAAETIRDMLWDGGLRDLAKLCGHHKEINQWRDVHHMLLAIHETLLMDMINQWQENSDGNSFYDFHRSLMDDTNSDEVSPFWANTLDYLNAYLGYYVSVRSVNWDLRNACLPKLSELFFAYSHNKYEELVCRSMRDCMQLPHEVLCAFMRGEWTVSATGSPYHSQAMDEAHESLVNKSTKDLTTRPTIYRIVELANFMAVLSKVYKGMINCINKFSSDRKNYVKTTTNLYVSAI